jgi:hypothetical protein
MNGRKGPTQGQLYYRAVRKTAEGNLLFLSMLEEGMVTKASLGRLIAKRPQTWGRFAGFLKALPD